MREAPDSEPCGPAVVINGIRQDCDVGVWDNAFDHAEAGGPWVSDASESFAHGADWAARWIAGLMGMAEAIRVREMIAWTEGRRGEGWGCPHDDGTDPDEPADRGWICGICEPKEST